jgi:prepilin-type N-terminal cleavage/methylation domain-containing protein
MNASISISDKRKGAFTLIELLVVLAVGTFLIAMILPAMSKTSHCTAANACISNLRQDGLAARIWADENGDKFPWELSKTNGGTMEFVTGPNAFRHFQVMSNELSTPKVLYCRADPDTNRTVAANFNNFCNSNISYFVGVGANQSNAEMILFGDRCLTNTPPFRNDVLELTKKDAVGWSDDLHERIGNMALADGSVRQLNTRSLRKFIKNSAVAINRLQMPVYGP